MTIRQIISFARKEIATCNVKTRFSDKKEYWQGRRQFAVDLLGFIKKNKAVTDGKTNSRAIAREISRR